jgi:outer membrane immunogenic protein
MKKQLITLLVLGLVGSVAQASESWDGFKAGLTFGSTNYTATWTDTSYGYYGGSLSHPKRAITPSIHAGWDHQMGSIVYGAELDYTSASVKREVLYATRVNNPTPNVWKTDDLKSVSTLRGRMGLVVDGALVYVTAGFAKVSANHTFTDVGDVPHSWPTFSNSHTGFAYGLGVEHRVNKMFSVRAEYQHVDVPEVVSVNPSYCLMEVGDAVSTFRVGASFHF